MAFVGFELLSSPFFVKPQDTLIGAIAGLIFLLSVDLSTVSTITNVLNILRSAFVVVFILLSITAAVSLWLHSRSSGEKGWKALLKRVSYRISVELGSPALIFTPHALISIYGFNQNQLDLMMWLSLLWLVLVVIRPIELAWRIGKEISFIRRESTQTRLIGTIDRVDSPDIVRVRLEEEGFWTEQSVQMAYFSASHQSYVLPLFSQRREDGLMGTGLCVYSDEPLATSAVPGHVYELSDSPARADLVKQLAGLEENVELIGFIVEGSSIQVIRFELSSELPIREGGLVFCKQGEDLVYYQILGARTFEESFERNPRGTHRVTAAQLGIVAADVFKKYPWLPAMNTPVFRPKGRIAPETAAVSADDLVLGTVPGSDIEIKANFDKLLEFHTAILGVTGTGKTELAYDVIRHGLGRGAKIFCVDFTGDYRVRLDDCSPEDLGLDDREVEELGELILDVETGEYSAGEEKRALNDFIESIRPNIAERVDGFLSPVGAGLSVFELPAIANTAATLQATELYLSTIFEWARQHRNERQILLVLEEAHTIIPEFNLYSRDRANTRAVVGRMAQIALQGRKFGVGLLLISQRTALVSKTLLSQCNTYVTFSLVDQTSLDYLANVYSAEHVQTIPRLRRLEALVFGSAIRSERPVVIEIPYDETKKTASESLNASELVAVEDDEQQEEEEDDLPF